MGYVFLWLEAMASALLMVAVVFAFSSRLKKWPTLWPIFTALLLCTLAITATVFAGFLFYKNIHPQWLFPHTFSWTLLFVAGSWILIRWGRIKAGETLVAASWSRSKIAGTFIIALAFQWNTMTTLDNTAKLEATADQIMALTKARTVLPSAPPYDQNAAGLYEQAATKLNPNPNQDFDEYLDRILDDSSNPASDPKSEPVQKLLLENKKTLDLIKEAVEMPYLYHPYILDSDLIEFPSIYPFKDAARLLALEARFHARNGHITAALESIFTIDKVAEQVMQTPLLVNILVASSIQNRSKSALEIILAENSTRAEIRIPLPVKTHHHILQAFKNSMVFEESFITFGWAKTITNNEPQELLELESEDFYEPEDSLRTKLFGYLYRIFLFQGDHKAVKTSWETTHDFFQKPYYDSGKALKEWEENINENIEIGYFTSRPTFTVSSYFERVNNAQTQFLLGQLGLASAAYHSDHDKYPDKLNALVPKYITEIPIDPFSGEPLKMIAMKNGLILYSIGPNLKDDQGAIFEGGTYGSDPTKGDIAFYLGSAYKEYRLKPALEKVNNKEEE